MQSKTYNIIVEQGMDGYLISSVIELPGCHTQAKNYDELYKRTKEAIELLFESCRLTGNYKNQESNLKSLFKPNRWNPSGTIQVYDHLVNRYIPLEGAEVHAR